MTSPRLARIIAAMSEEFEGAAALEARLAWLEEMGGAEFVDEIVVLFRESVPDTLRAARAARDEGDVAAVGAAAHSIKSSAANLGAMALAESSALCEEAVRSGDGDAAIALLDQMEKQSEEVMRELERRFPG